MDTPSSTARTAHPISPAQNGLGGRSAHPVDGGGHPSAVRRGRADRRPDRRETDTPAGDSGQLDPRGYGQPSPTRPMPAAARDIVVTGRNVTVPEHFRVHVVEKMAHLGRYDDTIIGYQVELFHEPNPRQAKTCQRVQITGTGPGAVVRAEAHGPDIYAALAAALAKLETRLHRSHDQRRVHHGHHRPTSVAAATAALAAAQLADPHPAPPNLPTTADPANEAVHDRLDDAVQDPDMSCPGHGPGQIVREKSHAAHPTTTDQALEEMELVGHDFYLFLDAVSGSPSVVYRRTGVDYGVIRLV